MSEITLSNKKIRLGVLPKVGGAISFFKYSQDGKILDIMRPFEKSSKADDANNASMFVMMPFCSRIRGGSFVYSGITRKMAKNHVGIQDPIHGDAWKSEWTVEEQSETRVSLSLNHNKDDGGFPFTYEGKIVYELIDNEFHISLSVKNPNPLPMPCGLGIHPFFTKTKEVELDFLSNMVWSNETDPIFDQPYATPETWRFDGGKQLKNAVFDTCFGGFEGKAGILYPDLGVSVEIEADDQFKHVILYCPRGKNFFCLEPVTNATNAFNLAANGAIGTGIKSIGPNQTMDAKIVLTIRG